MNRRFHRIVLAALALALVFLAGCGKATRESAESRYKSARDKLVAAATKNPMMKPAIDQQVQKFELEFAEAKGKQGDEDAIKAMGEVASRVEKFEQEVTKAPAAPAGAPAAGAPMAPGAVPGGMPVAPAAPGGKLGGPAPMGGAPMGAPVAPMVPPVAPGGKLGGGAPGVPPAAPQGGSGFGGQ